MRQKGSTAYSHLPRARRGLLAALLFLTIYLLLAYAIYSIFTSKIPSGNDFYPRWKGTRAFFIESKDPYSQEVTLEIQRGIYGRAAREDEDQVAFAYPLYVSLVILPLSLLPYPQAQALWMSGLVFLTLATVALTLRTFDGKPPASGLLALSIFCLLLYPTARSIILGQFTIPVLATVALTLFSMQKGWDFLAGCALALATIKPQMVFLITPFLLLWVVREKRWQMGGGFLAALALLLLLSSLLLPTWLPSFLAGLGRYPVYTSGYTGSRSPLGILFDFLLPPTLSSSATLASSLLLGGYMAYSWVEVWRGRWGLWDALFLTIMVTLLLPIQTGTTNQVFLVLPFIFWLARWTNRQWMAISLSLILLLGPWALFLATVQGDAEQPVMFLPLPLFSLCVFLALRLTGSRAFGGSDGK